MGWELAGTLSGPFVNKTGDVMSGELSVPDLVIEGLPGAVAASRYVGGTASGAPVTGTFAVGDFVIDQTGTVWICISAGSPGTWTSPSGGGGVSQADFDDLEALIIAGVY